MTMGDSASVGRIWITLLYKGAAHSDSLYLRNIDRVTLLLVVWRKVLCIVPVTVECAPLNGSILEDT